MSYGVVFAGLTITQDQIERVLDDVMVLPPVKVGDIIHVCRLMPLYILVIDGAFEACGSVWHKEILYALSLNIPVLGAASMGALRAAELYEYGMIGIGLVYDYYKNGILIDDDEVAVSYTHGSQEIKPLSDAMINIRETVNLALSQHIISDDFSQEVIAHIKAKNYKIRNLLHYLKMDCCHEQAPVFLEWLERGNVIDPKKRDAEAAINYVKKYRNLSSQAQKCIVGTLPFYSLYIDINSAPFPYHNNLLPAEELRVQEIVGFRSDIKYFTVLSKLMCISAIFYEGSDDEASLLSFFKEVILQESQGLLEEQRGRLEKFFNILFDNAEIDEKLLKNIICFWVFIVSKLESKGGAVTISEYEKFETSKQFRIKRKLFTADTMMLWLNTHHMSPEGYDDLMSFLSLFYYGVNCNNLMYLSKKVRNIHWLKVALILSDVFF